MNFFLKIILNKPRFFSKNVLDTDLNVQTFRLSRELQTLLYMNKVKTSIKQYQPSHVYYTRLQNNNNLNEPLIKSNFGNQNPIIKGVLLLRKYDIGIFSFINFILY